MTELDDGLVEVIREICRFRYEYLDGIWAVDPGLVRMVAEFGAWLEEGDEE